MDSQVQAQPHNVTTDGSQYAPYAMSGGWAPRKKPKTKVKAKPRGKGRASPKKSPKKAPKMYVGRSGGKYFLKKGRKVYVC